MTETDVLARNLIGPVLGGILADPGALYPSVFSPHSPLARHRYLLPNLIVALLQAISWIMAFFFLPETHPKMSTVSDVGLRTGQALKESLQPGSTLAPEARVRPTDSERPRELDNMDADRGDREQTEISWKGVFTLQIVFQILAVSLLAFHKVAFDAFMPTFLAAPSSAESPKQHERNIMDSTGGFGYGSQKIGLILLSQAIVVLIAQATVVSRMINWAGPLTACRVVFGLYPAAYALTPFLPFLASPAGRLITVALDLWITGILSSIGYICSAILLVIPNYLRDTANHLYLLILALQIRHRQQSSSHE